MITYLFNQNINSIKLLFASDICFTKICFDINVAIILNVILIFFIISYFVFIYIIFRQLFRKSKKKIKFQFNDKICD